MCPSPSSACVTFLLLWRGVEASGATDLTLMRQRVRVFDETVSQVEEGVAVGG